MNVLNGWLMRPIPALAKASITMDKADMWWARLAVKTLRWDQREAIAAAPGAASSRVSLSGSATAPARRSDQPVFRTVEQDRGRQRLLFEAPGFVHQGRVLVALGVAVDRHRLPDR